jgi:hypothetical protein
MLMYQSRATFECEFSGQRRAYSDTTTEGWLIMEMKSDDRDWQPLFTGEPQARSALRGLVGFKDRPDNPSDAYLKEFIQAEPGIWRVLVVSRYND